MNISEIVKRQFCLGCGLCVSDQGQDKLQIAENAQGFLVPEVQNGFSGEVIDLENYCPGVTVSLDRKLRNKYENLYGPFLDLKVGYSKDETIRYKGSSGGVLTAILCGLLESGKIDGVLQVGPGKVVNSHTEVFFSTTTEEIISNAGSRYAPASLLENFKAVLETHQKIAVVGKPCDVVAVKQYLRVNPQYKDKVYCTLSFMCMGLPSRKATSRLINRLGVEDPSNVKELNYRGRGWPGEAYVVNENDQSRACSYDESWGKILGRDLLFRCKICPDGWGSFADISSGDPWYSDGKKPIFEDRPGRSFIFTRTEKGKEVLKQCSQYLAIEEYDINELPIIQKSQVTRKNRLWIRYLILKLRGYRFLKFEGLGIWTRMFTTGPIGILGEIRGFFQRLPR